MANQSPIANGVDAASWLSPQTVSRGSLASGQHLDEETIDDLLYLARTNEVAELQSLINELAAKLSASQTEIVALAFDPQSGNGCLHMSAGNGHMETLQYLLPIFTHVPAQPYGLWDLTAPSSSLLDWPNQAGNTALHYAAMNGQLPTVKTLVAAGANPQRKNGAGHDAIFEAEQAGKDETVAYLLSVGQGGEEEKVDAAEVANSDPEVTAGQQGEEGTMNSTNGQSNGEWVG